MPDASKAATIDVDHTVADRPVVHLVGEFDLAASDDLRDLLFALVDEQQPAAIVVDLARLAFIDSEAIGAILDGYAAATQAGVAFRLLHAYGIVRRVFQVLGLLALFDETAPTAAPTGEDLPEPSEPWRRAVVRDLRARDDTTS